MTNEDRVVAALNKVRDARFHRDRWIHEVEKATAAKAEALQHYGSKLYDAQGSLAASEQNLSDAIAEWGETTQEVVTDVLKLPLGTMT